jgi:hypothetical protein
MSIMTIVALTLSLVALCMGATSILAGAGQQVDMRKARRRKDHNRMGGRRHGDHAPALA